MDLRRPHLQLEQASAEPLLLDRFGALIGREEDFSNPMLQLLGYPIAKRRDGGYKKQHSPCEFRAGIAALGALEQGRVYHKGQPVKEGLIGQERRYIEFCAPSGQAGYDEIETFVRAALYESTVISAFKEDEQFESAVKRFEARSWLTTQQGASSATAQEVEIVINELEIIRYYYTNSNHLTKSVFAGHFHQDVVYSKVLSNEISEARYYPETDTHWLQYRSPFSQNDVPIIARILFDPLARAGAERVQRSLLRSTLHHKLRIGHARTTFPFAGLARLEVIGKWEFIRGEKVFMVDRIEQCDRPFPFRHLHATSTTAARGTASAESDGEEDKKSITITGPAAQQGPMNSLALAAANSVTATWVPALRRFPNAHFTVDFDAPPAQPGAGLKRYFLKNGDLIETSPGGTTYGQTNAIKQAIEDELVTGTVPEGLKTFADVLKKLSPYSAHTLAIGSSWRDLSTGIDYCPFPRVSGSSGRLNPFSFTDPSRKVRRYFVVAEVRTGRGHHYIFDAEESSSSSSPPLGVLVLWQIGREPIQEVDVEAFIEATVQTKRWARSWLKSRNWNCKQLKHTVGSVFTDLSERIRDALTERYFDPNY